MKRLLVATCLVLMSVSQSFALSCETPSIEGSYKWHSEAKDDYILVSGEFTNKGDVVLGPKSQEYYEGRSEHFTGTFVGHQATRAGFDRPFETKVAINTVCAGEWCGSVDFNAPMVTFLEVTSYGYELTVGPCGGGVFYNPTKDQKRRALRCLRGGVC